MKFLVVISTVLMANIVQGLTDEQKSKLEEYSKECLKESKVDESVLKEAEKGVYLDDPKLMNHVYCLVKKINSQKDKGELEVTQIKEKLMMQINDEKEVDKLIQLCLVQEKSARYSLGKCEVSS
ncbi:odorant binding protein C05 [Tribolium castaneum]|uniref:Odorant binding protein C05 n=1 Tax=Tribolium castaneum TaxID=7070 RepID=D6WS39_TRICA|nr:odorant binding protein C05 [Tribolium castaneum]